MEQVLLLSYNTFQGANNKGTHQTSRMRRLVCAFVVHMRQSQVLSQQRPKYDVRYAEGLYNPNMV